MNIVYKYPTCTCFDIQNMLTQVTYFYYFSKCFFLLVSVAPANSDNRHRSIDYKTVYSF